MTTCALAVGIKTKDANKVAAPTLSRLRIANL